MQNLLNDLTELLSKDDRLVSEGKLLKNKVIELALKMDAALIKYLLKNEAIKKHFFTDIDGILVFDKIKFQKFVSNKEFLPDSYTAFKNKIGLVNEQRLPGPRGCSGFSMATRIVFLKADRQGRSETEMRYSGMNPCSQEIDRSFLRRSYKLQKHDMNGEHELKGKVDIDFSGLFMGNNRLPSFAL
jgi:adenine-specific DNA-methyltransferase